MANYESELQWIKQQQKQMVTQLCEWIDINSHFNNIEGLATMRQRLVEAFTSLGAQMEEVQLPPRSTIDNQGFLVSQPVGKALRMVKRPEASKRIFLGGHMDTVYPKECTFQKSTLRQSRNQLHGPGSADMKGGLMIMLQALQAFERFPNAQNVGWEVIINSDEEIGSVSSEPLFFAAADRNCVGLIFEPAFIDGTIVNQRKGSTNFSVLARGKAAHAGRDFFLGRNAITALARFMTKTEALIDDARGITFNVGHVEGGETTNIVPDLSICRCNVRVNTIEELESMLEQIHHLIEEENQREGLSLTLHQETQRPPKPFDAPHQHLYESLAACAQELEWPLSWKQSGGVCDGNILAAAGLPTIDTLGVVGANMHTHEEYLLIDSLVPRTQLTALYLMKVANGEIAI